MAAEQYQHFYGWAWQRARAAWLTRNPLCVMCMQRGIIRAAEVVDHIVPHRGDKVLFWDEGNWQSLCTQCHDGPKREQELTGRLRGCDPGGVPLDDGHHWHTHGGQAV